MKSNPLDISEYQKVVDFGKSLFHAKELKYLVTGKVQNAEIERLQSGLRHEVFYFIIDLVNGCIKKSGGLENLKINPQNFTLKSYFEMMPKSGISNLLTLLGKQTFLLSNIEYIGFLKPTYIVQLPLKVYADSDKLYLVKREISPFQITEDGQIAEYLSYFTIIKEYNHEELNPRFIGIPSELQKQVEKFFAVGFSQLPPQENKFAPKELILLEMYLRDPEISNKELSIRANITVSTLHSYNKQIIQKARQMFGDDLPVRTAKDVAFYLQKNGLYRFE